MCVSLQMVDQTDIQSTLFAEPECDVCGLQGECECILCESCQVLNAEPLCENCETCSLCCDCSHCESCGPVDNVCERCELCSDHCTCQSVDCRCGTVGESDFVCENCNACEDHCSCFTCDNCMERFSEEEYGENGCCQSCSDSGTHSNVDIISRSVKFHSADKGQFKQNPSKRFIAVELEIASSDDGSSYGIDCALRKWNASAVEDSSLPDSGYEINSSPAQGDVFCQQVDDICAALNSADAKVDDSCGYHVHIDARDLKYPDIRRLMRVYAIIEPALFAMVPPSRRASSYCHPCGSKYGADSPIKSTRDLRHDVATKVYGSSNTRTRKTSKYDCSRYAALNLHSWFLRGTVECRLAAGTTSADKVKSWAILWASIVDFAATKTDREIDALRSADGDVSYAVLQSIAPTQSVKAFIARRTEKFSS